MSCDKIDLAERLYYFQSNTGQIFGRGAFRRRFWSRKSDGTGFDTSREPTNHFGHLPLLRDRDTWRAMERRTFHGSDYFKAGTRAEEKRPIDTLDMIMREALMTRTRIHVQRLEGVARLRGLHPRIVAHLVRKGLSLPLQLESGDYLTLRGEVHPMIDFWSR